MKSKADEPGYLKNVYCGRSVGISEGISDADLSDAVSMRVSVSVEMSMFCT